jgi:CBS domain containing-hemolysin-like protein
MAGFFSAAEIGFLSLNKIRVKNLAEKGNIQACITIQILDDLPRFLTGMLIGINTAIVTASCVTTSLFEKWALLAEGILVIVILLFGEIIPKTISRYHATQLILSLIQPIKIFYIMLLPIVNLIVRVLEPFIARRKQGPFITREDLRFLIEECEEYGAIQEEEEKMIRDVLELSETKVKEVMTPRTDMICLPAECNIHELINTLSKYRYSRIPVYDETIDNIIGILYVKDLLNFWSKWEECISVVDFIRLPYFIPTTKRIDDLLEEFQRYKIQIAIVVDEYGGTAGLVTLEDVLEKIVGEIQDEYDIDDIPIRKKNKNVFLINGDADIELVNKTLNINIPKGDFETISGFILDYIGRIPKKGETITYQNLILNIMRATERNIKKIELKIVT